ncbi:hypothetical protein BDZ45DRAFT_746573 [Acephala macrosclerotiorum]|nr:hypothetical protein BDZ45DRAFT_746573 [Acephala macrosclerotiorum]
MAEDSVKTSATIALSKITKLKTSTEWKKWKIAIDEWTVDQDLDLPAPIAPERERGRGQAVANYNNRLAAYESTITLWNQKQLKGVNSIRSTCKIRAKNFIANATTVAEALQILELPYKPKGDASFQEVHSEWIKLNLSEDKSVEDYVERFDDLHYQP